MSLQEIESAVSELSSSELAAFRRWFLEFDADGWDAASAALDRVLIDRLVGPFAPLEPDWKERVRRTAAKLRDA